MTSPSAQTLVLCRGGGELASASVRRLALGGFPVIVLETERPTCLRRTVSFANAVYRGQWAVEGVEARLASDPGTARQLLEAGVVPVLVDPAGASLPAFKPTILLDARMAKRNLWISATQAPVVIALGPGFEAPRDAHFVIETIRGHDLGRVITQGSAQPDTGLPGEVGGEAEGRLLRAPQAGLFQGLVEIGDRVEEGGEVARIGDRPVSSRIGGVVRGLIHSGLRVKEGQKVGDVDPRGDPTYAFRVSDKANAVAGGVLEAVLRALTAL